MSIIKLYISSDYATSKAILHTDNSPLIVSPMNLNHPNSCLFESRNTQGSFIPLTLEPTNPIELMAYRMNNLEYRDLGCILDLEKIQSDITATALANPKGEISLLLEVCKYLADSGISTFVAENQGINSRVHGGYDLNGNLFTKSR